MSKLINTSGLTTRLALSTVSSVMAANAGPHTIAVWLKKDATIGSFSLCTLASASINNAALWAENVSSTTSRVRCRANGSDSAIISVAEDLESWSLVKWVCTTATGIGSFACGQGINSTKATPTSISAGTGIPIDSLSFGAAQFNSATFGYTADLNLAYIAVWEGHLSTEDQTALETLAPHLVDTDNLLWASDSELVQVAGSVTEVINVHGTDITSDTADNPTVALTLGIADHRYQSSEANDHRLVITDAHDHRRDLRR